jgi:hypothetical protein
MKAEVAVATVQGKSYFLIVKKLKESNIPFFSLIPGDEVPAEVKVIITTKQEKYLIKHRKILVYDIETEFDPVTDKVRRLLQGREVYDRIIIGIDPGEVFGLAVIADGKVSETGNCFSIHEALAKITAVIRGIDFLSTAVIIKIGNGIPSYRELIAEFDLALPLEVVLEVVSEAGTSRPINHIKQRRGFRDIASAIQIAGRAGHTYPRRKPEK